MQAITLIRRAVLVTILALPACGSSGGSQGAGDAGTGGSDGGDGSGPYTAQGVVQKGPFNIGATMTIQELDGALDATGRTFNAETTDNFGSFELPTALTSPIIEIIAQGFYYDEIAGQSSSSPLTLRTYSDLTVNQVVNVNVLTDLLGQRLANLIDGGATFADADAQARAEVLRVFGVEDAAGSFDDMDIAADGDDNAILLAASAVMQQMATTQADSPATVVAELSERLQGISADLAPDGVLDDAALKQDLIDAGMTIDLAGVRGNLETRFAELGTGTAPAFEGYIDSDGDGLLNKYDYPLAFTPAATTQLATPVTSEALEIQIFDGSTQAATVSIGTIVLNGNDTAAATAQVVDGDMLAVKLVSTAQYLDAVTRTTADVSVGMNQGSFTLATRFAAVRSLYRAQPGDGLGDVIVFAGADVLAIGRVPPANGIANSGTLLRFDGTDGTVKLAVGSFGDHYLGAPVSLTGQVLVQAATAGPTDVLLIDDTTGALIRTFADPAALNGNTFGRAYTATAAVVAIADVGNASEGTVHIFDRALGTLLRSIPGNVSDPSGDFGRALAISGNDLVIGDVTGTNSRDSVVGIYDVNGTLQRTLTDPTPVPNGTFGWSLAVANGHILVGDIDHVAGGFNQAGAVHVFDAATGAFVRTIENPIPEANSGFGMTLAVDGNDLLVGSWQQDSGGVANAGSAFLFDHSTGQLRFMYPNPEPGAQNQYGLGVAIAGGHIAIGDTQASPGGHAGAGVIYLFDTTQGVIAP